MGGCHVAVEQAFNLIWGYNAAYAERISNLAASLGVNLLYGTVVPAGELWVAVSLVAFDTIHNPDLISLGVYDATTWFNLTQKAGPGIGATVEWTGIAPIPAGSRAFAYFTSCNAGDDIYLDIIGYKMKLSQ